MIHKPDDKSKNQNTRIRGNQQNGELRCYNLGLSEKAGCAVSARSIFCNEAIFAIRLFRQKTFHHDRIGYFRTDTI